MESVLIDVVAALIKDASGKVLIAKRKLESSNGGVWEFPGGKVDAGETKEQAIVREIAEELGCVVLLQGSVGFVEHSYPHLAIRLHGFWATVQEGIPMPIEHDRLEFCSWDKLRTFPMGAADALLIEKVEIDFQG